MPTPLEQPVPVSSGPRSRPRPRNVSPAEEGQSPAPYTADDFHHSPFVAFYEVTQACDLVCQHCRACAQPRRDPQELDHDQARALIDQFAAFPKPPVLVFTGGDPLKRADIFDLVAHARARGLSAAMTPSATPLVTRPALERLKEMGLHRLAVSLDGKDAATHDAFRGVAGSFQRTLEILADARAIGLPLQVNTTITRRNAEQVDAMADLLAEMGIVLWSVFFLIPVGRGMAEQRIAPAMYEAIFERLWHHARTQPYGIKTTEAHHYRRFVLQHAAPGSSAPGTPGRAGATGSLSAGASLGATGSLSASASLGATGSSPASASLGAPGSLPAGASSGATGSLSASAQGSTGSRLSVPPTTPGSQAPGRGKLRVASGGRAPLGVNDGRGVMFVSHTGRIYPSGFLPIDCGRFPRDSIIDVYQQHPTFRELREPNLLGGKCGRCEFRQICGGSRARAYALTGDPLAAEPDCVYQPK